MQNARVEIHLLGGLRIVASGSDVDRLPTQRLVSLLAYMALHPGWQVRETIAEAIWPDLPEGKGLASFRNALSVLRRILEPDATLDAAALEATRTHARLSSADCDVDVWRFKLAAGHKDDARAIAAYGGDLLPQLHDEWLEPFREDLRRCFIEALGRETERHLACALFEEAVELANRWLKHDPFEARAVHVLALAHGGAGRPQAGLRCLDAFVESYRGAFGDGPPLDIAGLRLAVETVAKEAVPHIVHPIKADMRALREPKGDLRVPLYLTQFFGRERDLARIEEWAKGPSQLLTITGMGGIGKTRLASEGGKLIANTATDVLFIPLAGADTQAAIVSALISALDLREDEAALPKEVLLAHLAVRDRAVILILDNLEQVVRPAAEVVLEMLATGSNLKVLCTSRELLAIEGEQLIALAPLDAPGEAESTGESAADDVAKLDSVRMFIDRARSSRADFALTQRNCQEVAALCRELDGLPLAIEIMAAWSGTWSVAEMRAHVRKDRVVARKRGHEDRHRSLEACIEWSFQLLDSETKHLLSRLSLFRGGWTLEAAEAVTGVADVAEALAALADRSLINSADVDGGIRFSMLETVRTHARSKLTEDDARETAARFVDYFVQLAKTLTNPCAGQVERLNHTRLDRERENIESVVPLCEEGIVAVDQGLALGGALHLHWVYRGRSRAGLALIERLLAVPTTEPPGRGRVFALQTLSVLAQEMGDLELAQHALDDLQTVADLLGDAEATIRVATQLGNILNRYGRFAEALVPHRRVLETGEVSSNPRWAAVGHCNLAESLFGLDRIEEARIHWQVAEDYDRLNGNIAGEAMLFMGFSDLIIGDATNGARRLLVYLRNVQGLGFGRGYQRAVSFAALCAGINGEWELAATLLASLKAYAAQESLVFDATEVKCLDIVQEAIKSSARPDALLAGKMLAMEEAIALADRFLSSFAADSSASNGDNDWRLQSG